MGYNRHNLKSRERLFIRQNLGYCVVFVRYFICFRTLATLLYWYYYYYYYYMTMCYNVLLC